MIVECKMRFLLWYIWVLYRQSRRASTNLLQQIIYSIKYYLLSSKLNSGDQELSSFNLIINFVKLQHRARLFQSWRSCWVVLCDLNFYHAAMEVNWQQPYRKRVIPPVTVGATRHPASILHDWTTLVAAQKGLWVDVEDTPDNDNPSDQILVGACIRKSEDRSPSTFPWASYRKLWERLISQ